MEDTIVKQLSFHSNDEKEFRAVSLLQKANRKKARLVALALQEFSEKYGLDNKSSSDISKFVQDYEFIKISSESRQMPYQVIREVSPMQSVTSALPPVERKEHTPAPKVETPIRQEPVQTQPSAKNFSISAEEKQQKLNKLLGGFQV